jgi:hypothetical protein
MDTSYNTLTETDTTPTTLEAETCTECGLPAWFEDDNLDPDGMCIECRLDLDEVTA